MYLRSTGRLRPLSSVRQLLTAALVAVAVFVISGSVSTARADDRPFWDKEDVVKKPSARKVAHRASSRRTASRKAQRSYAQSKPRKKLGGYAEQTEPKKHRKGVRVASLDHSVYTAPKKSLSGGSVNWTASSSCLDGTLRSVIGQVASLYGPVTVNSTCRSRSHNAAVGGAPRSKHLSGDAVDFRVHGNIGAVYAYLKSSGSVGGLKHYGGGLFHIDNGERRTW